MSYVDLIPYNPTHRGNLEGYEIPTEEERQSKHKEEFLTGYI